MAAVCVCATIWTQDYQTDVELNCAVRSEMSFPCALWFSVYLNFWNFFSWTSYHPLHRNKVRKVTSLKISAPHTLKAGSKMRQAGIVTSSGEKVQDDVHLSSNMFFLSFFFLEFLHLGLGFKFIIAVLRHEETQGRSETFRESKLNVRIFCGHQKLSIWSGARYVQLFWQTILKYFYLSYYLFFFCLKTIKFRTKYQNQPLQTENV